MKYARRKWYSMLADLAIRLSGDRPERADMVRRLKRASFESDVGRLGLRMSDHLREQLRRRWLRIKK